jgi:hypothetical protein
MKAVAKCMIRRAPQITCSRASKIKTCSVISASGVVEGVASKSPSSPILLKCSWVGKNDNLPSVTART